MPIHSYLCSLGHETEKLFLTFAAAEEPGADIKICGQHTNPDDGMEICGEIATRVQGVPAQAILFGEGFYKGSPQQRGSYKVADSTKVAKEMADSARAQNGGRITGPRQ